MDGIEATKKIRSLPGGADVRIVAVTASAFAEQRDEMLAMGLDDFVRKPYRPIEIYDCLATHLGIEYLYDSIAGDRFHLTPESFVSVPGPILVELRDALQSLHIVRIEKAVKSIADYDQNLCRQLESFVSMFDYSTVIRAIEGNR